MKISRNLIKMGIFLCILSGILFCVLRSFVISDNRIYQTWNSFYSEKENDLDAVYIGASNVYPFWASPVAWHDYGLTVFPLSVPNLPAKAIRFYIDEALKTQKNALYIISLNTFKEPEIISTQAAHLAVDRMKLSKTKTELINAIIDDIDDEEATKAELYFPFIRFHARWDEFKTEDYNLSANGLKGASEYSSFLEKSNDISKAIQYTDEKYELDESQEAVLNDLMDFCEEKSLRVLFVIVPQGINSEKSIGQLNTMEEAARARGFDTLNLMNQYKEIGLLPEEDYYNENHLNVHGCLKFTDYFSNYMKQNYGFEDKRGQKEFISWDESYEKYMNIIREYVLDFELDHSERDYTIEKPAVISCEPVNSGIRISWESVQNCNRYDVYRKAWSEKNWKRIGSVSSEESSCYDPDVKPDAEYMYHVVPVRTDGEKDIIGNYDYDPCSSILGLEAPEIETIEKTNQGIRISWKPVENADGYYVYRKAEDGDWEIIADISKTVTEYTVDQAEDTDLYSVSAYQGEDATVKTAGAINEPGIDISMAEMGNGVN